MAKPSAKVRRAWLVQYEALFYLTLTAIVSNDETARDFAEFRTATKKLAETERHIIAKYASEHYVAKASPNPGKLKEDETAALMKESIREALKKRANE